MNTNNGVKWRRFIVPKTFEQINDHLSIDTYKYADWFDGNNLWRSGCALNLVNDLDTKLMFDIDRYELAYSTSNVGFLSLVEKPELMTFVFL